MKSKKLFQEEPIKINSFEELFLLKDKYSRYQKLSYTCSMCNKTRITTLYNLIRNKDRFKKCSNCISLNKREQSFLQKYGVKNPQQIKEIKEKTKQTCLKRYGVDNPAKAEKIKEKVRENCVKKYNVYSANSLQSKKNKCKETCLKKYGVAYIFQSKDFRKKSKQTCLKKYGKEYITQTQHFKDITKQTCLKRYGVENSSLSTVIKNKRKNTVSKFTEEKRKSIKNKRKNTLLQKYGKSNYHNIKKQQETCIKKYGVLSWSQTKNSHNFHKKSYLYQSFYFDSKPELSFWIYCKDHSLNIKKCKDCFEYTYNSQKYFYFPDFEINEKYFEIKGNQFLKKDNTWCNPFDHTQDEKYEAKHQCALKNNVTILYTKDYQKYLNYVKEKYGKKFLDQFKIKKQNKDVSNQSSKVEEIKENE